MSEILGKDAKSELNLLRHQVLLIDLENCPASIHFLQNDLTVFHQVVICYANAGPKLPLDWLVPLSRAVKSRQLRIVKMEQGGKNAADFGLCFFAGMLAKSLSKKVHFFIVSNDSDLDHVVRLLKSEGRSAERVGKTVTPVLSILEECPQSKGVDTNASPSNGESSKNTDSTLKKVQGNTVDLVVSSADSVSILSLKKDDAHNALAVYSMHLLTHSQNRPASEKTLRSSILAKCGGNQKIADSVFQCLLSHRAVSQNATRIVYHETILEVLAKK